MRKPTLASLMAAGLALLWVSAALAAVNPAAPNPCPTRESKVLADFESATMVTSDPNGTGGNLASINTDSQFVAEGSKSLKLDLTGVAAGWHDPEFTINFPLTPDQAKMLTNVNGMFFITNSGSNWTGPVYVDNLRAVIPTP